MRCSVVGLSDHLGSFDLDMGRFDLRNISTDRFFNHKWAIYLSTFIALILIFFRYQSAYVNPMFWAEDGWIWYPCTYERGWICFFEPVSGYLQTFSRVVAMLSQLLPIDYAPKLFSLMAIIVQITPAIFVLSDRLSGAVPSRDGRFILFLFIICMPANYETFANVTNSQWHLALLSFLILIANAPRGQFSTAFDVVVLSLSGLSGPFALLLMPVAALQLWWRRDRAAAVRFGIVAGAALVQLSFIMMTAAAARMETELGAGLVEFLVIFGRQVVFAGVLGIRAMIVLLEIERSLVSNVPSIILGIIGLIIVILAAYFGKRELRLFLLFSFSIMFAALISPVVSIDEPQWQALARRGVGTRYFIFPIMAWFCCLLTLVVATPVMVRRFAGATMAATLVGVAGDWRYPDIGNQAHLFRAQAAIFAAAPVGSRVDFPIRPANSVMSITKKQ